MMKTVLSLLTALSLLATVLSGAAQESREALAQQLEDLYGPPVAETFLMPGRVLIRARYSERGLACTLRIEPESRGEARDLPLALAQRLLDEFVPARQQQQPSQAVGLTSGPCGGINWSIYPLVSVSRASRCDESGTAWLQRLDIHYKTPHCQALLQADQGVRRRAVEPAQTEEEIPQWTRWAPESLRALYGPPLEQSFAVGQGAVLKARLGSDGQPCRMLIERQTFTRSALVPQAAEKILAAMPPLADAGPPLESSSLAAWDCIRRERQDYAEFSVEVEHSSCTSSGGIGVTRIVVDLVSNQCPADTIPPARK